MDMKEINRQVIEQFRAGGKITGMQRERLVLLTTVGARTGQKRTTPMMFHRDGDRLLVIASNAGAPRHPDWYRNPRRAAPSRSSSSPGGRPDVPRRV